MSILAPLQSPFTHFPVRRALTVGYSKHLHRLRPLRSLPYSDDDLLRSISSSRHDGDAPSHAPAVRSYENDLARLTIVGAAGFEQAVTAAAADGGNAAREHLSSGMQTMVLEAVFPGSPDEHSTISTKLFLPAREVDGRAKKLRARLSLELFFDNISRNILAMTFRQVTLQYIWNLEIVLFHPGVERDMDDLSAMRENQAYFTMSSSDEHLLDALAEVICSSCFSDIKNKHLQASDNIISRGLHFFYKPEKTCSADLSVCLIRLPKYAIVEEAKRRMGNLAKWRHNHKGRDLKNKWWTPPNYSSLGKGEGPWFSSWINEYIPAYKIQIDGSKFKDAKFQGFLNSSENRWEVLLTHFQMVELANVLDIFYEDRFILKQERVSFNFVGSLSPTSLRKGSKWKMILMPIALACLLVFVGILVRLFAPRLLMARKAFDWQKPASLSDAYSCQIQSLGIVELEPLCISVVQRIRDSLAYSGEIVFDPIIGAWTGQLPPYLRRENDPSIGNKFDTNNGEHVSTPSTDQVDKNDLPANSQSLPGEESQAPICLAQDIASYQLVFTNDGFVVGFQPMNRVAVNYWASNPFSKLLHRRKKISPGFLEPSVKFPLPDKIILIQLLVSVNPKTWFALARPFKV